MNIEDLKNSLNELKNKQKDNLIKRRTLIKEMKTMPSARLSRKMKAKDGAVQALVIDVEACKQERAENPRIGEIEYQENFDDYIQELFIEGQIGLSIIRAQTIKAIRDYEEIGRGCSERVTRFETGFRKTKRYSRLREKID